MAFGGAAFCGDNPDHVLIVYAKFLFALLRVLSLIILLPLHFFLIRQTTFFIVQLGLGIDSSSACDSTICSLH